MRTWVVALRAGLVLSVLLGGLAVVWVAGAGPAHACRCYMGTPAEQLEGADVIFLGDVVSREKTDSGLQRLYTIEVTRVFKGDVAPVQEVVALWDNGGSCGLNLPRQGSVLIVSSPEHDAMTGPIADGQYGTWGCSGSRPATKAPAAFGDGWAPTGDVGGGNAAPEPTLVDTESRWVPVAVGGLAVVLLGGAAGVLLWRRRRAD